MRLLPSVVRRQLLCFTTVAISAMPAFGGAKVSAAAQTPAPKAAARRTVSVLMLSDIHFDPYRDPSKFPRLRSAPISEWPAILAAAPTAADPEAFAALQRTCRIRGVDSDWTLLHASLTAAHDQQPSPFFVTVSGDLMAHGFDCRFRQLASSSTDADLSAFAAKTVAFVAVTLHNTFPGRPVYLGLGNNDSGCSDYHESPGSEYLKESAQSVSAGLPADDRVGVESSFADQGDYSVVLPRPMQATRLIVLQDIYQSKRYKGCGAGDDAKAAEQQIAWLRTQLSEARDHHQAVWVMAHIPPGIDVYATITKGTNVCTGAAPEMFLHSDKLTSTLAEFAPAIRFVLLAHSHMDEMRLFHSGDLTGGSRKVPDAIPGKLVPSISPINGNNPAFTIAQVDPRTATVMDYEVYASDNATGVQVKWAEEYRYSAAYHEPDFSAASVSDLLLTMRDDKTAADPSTGNYSKYFYAGDGGLHALALRLVWPAYSCAMTETTETGYRGCVCAGKPSEPATAPASPGTVPGGGKPSPQR